MKPPKIKILKSPTFRKKFEEFRQQKRSHESSMTAIEGTAQFLFGIYESSTAWKSHRDEVKQLTNQMRSLWKFQTVTVRPQVSEFWISFRIGKKLERIRVQFGRKTWDLHIRNAISCRLWILTGGRSHQDNVRNAEKVVAYYRSIFKTRRKTT